MINMKRFDYDELRELARDTDVVRQRIEAIKDDGIEHMMCLLSGGYIELEEVVRQLDEMEIAEVYALAEDY